MEGTSPLRKYEPLDYIAVPQGEGAWRGVVMKLKKEEETVAAELAQIEGYQKIANDQNKADFEFYLRPVSNSDELYMLGNPYFLGQIAGLGPGYRLLERELKVRHEEEFTKKKDQIEIIKQYVDIYGPKSRVMPEFQVVVTDNGWYFEDEDLFKDRKALNASPAQWQIEGIRR